MVHTNKKDAILVSNPSTRKSPPTASLNAPIQAKNTGAKAKIPPYSATSFGNHATTSKNPKFAVEDQGKPNLSDPKPSVNKSPHIILGIANRRSPVQCFCFTGVLIIFTNFRIRVFISLLFVRFDETKLQLKKRLGDSSYLKAAYIRFRTAYFGNEFKNSVGELFVSFLNTLLKVALLLNPES